jgi:hypothetical protein
MVIVRKSEGFGGARRRGQDPTLQPSTIADPATVHVAFEYRTCEHLFVRLEDVAAARHASPPAHTDTFALQVTSARASHGHGSGIGQTIGLSDLADLVPVDQEALNEAEVNNTHGSSQS